MHAAIALLGLAGSAFAFPQASSAPAGCSPSHDGVFDITTVNVTKSATKRSLKARQVLELTLKNGILHDQDNRQGYIASNYQFQFDPKPQPNALVTSGFSLCSNGSLALGDSAIFYQCLSGGFYNLYNTKWAPQCNAIYLVSMGGSATTTEGSDGQPAAVSQITDGQPQATTAGAPITQLTDGQPQGQTGSPVTQLTDGQPQGPGPVTQLSDGQPQGPKATGAPVSQITDGQPQAPKVTGSPVSQISDGQPQAPVTGAPVSQISDGQPQAPTVTGSPVSQISDGQPQAAVSTPAGPMFTGAAAPAHGAMGAAVVGMAGLLALL